MTILKLLQSFEFDDPSRLILEMMNEQIHFQQIFIRTQVYPSLETTPVELILKLALARSIDFHWDFDLEYVKVLMFDYHATLTCEQFQDAIEHCVQRNSPVPLRFLVEEIKVPIQRVHLDLAIKQGSSDRSSDLMRYLINHSCLSREEYTSLLPSKRKTITSQDIESVKLLLKKGVDYIPGTNFNMDVILQMDDPLFAYPEILGFYHLGTGYNRYNRNLLLARASFKNDLTMINFILHMHNE